MAKPWLAVAIILCALGVTRSAHAAVVVMPSSPAIADPIDGATETTSTVTIQTSGADIDIDIAKDATCTNAAKYSIDQTHLVFAPGGGTTTVEVGYTASTRPADTCKFNITPHLLTTPVLATITVAGTGTAPELTVVETGTLDFLAARVKDPGARTKNLTIRNSGEGTLHIAAAPAFSGTDAADFSITSPAFPQDIASGSNVTVVMSMNPSASGTRSATVTVTATNDPVTATEARAVTGTGTNAVIAVTDFDFSTVPSGTSSGGNVSISNTATAPVGPLTVTDASITQSSTWFSFSAGNGCVAGSTTCTFSPSLAIGGTAKTVSFDCAPPVGAAGTQTATVAFTNNSDAGGDNMSTLTCTAGSPVAVITPASMAFGNQRINTTSIAQTVTIKNTGNINLTYSISHINDATNQFTLTAGCSSACSLAPSAMATATVTFNPTTIGAKTGTIHITTNDSNALTTDIGLTGMGTAPVATFTPTSLAFSNVDVGKTSATMSLQLKNTGDAPLIVTNAALTGGDKTSFTVAGATTGAQLTSVAPAATLTWTIACRPTTTGMLVAAFALTSDTGGPTGTTTNVVLTCFGQEGRLTITESPFDFGGVAAGAMATHMFTLTNVGNLPVTNITAALSDDTLGYSVEAPTFPIASLAAGGTVQVTIKFAPADANAGGNVNAVFSGVWGAANTTASVTLMLTGDGLTTGYDVTPPTLDFGDIRYDAAPVKSFCIVNTGQADVNITSITFSPTTAMTGEITILDLKRRPCMGSGGTTIAWPLAGNVLLTAGQTVEIEVKVDPADRTGAIGGTLMVMSDQPVNPARTVTVAAVSTTAMLAVNPSMIVDFGTVDLDVGPSTINVKIKNTGTARLDLGAFSYTAHASFTIDPVGAQALAPGAEIEVPIVFNPTMERAAGQEETFTITHSIGGVLNGPTMEMITMKGRGIDRHIQLGTPPAFPPTFRNPGSMAPVMPVRVTNTGDAPLVISALMVTNSDVWQLEETGMVTIPGASSGNNFHDFNVRFVPKVAGKAPVGQLVIMNDDNTTQTSPMAMMLFEGDGIDRNVSLLGDPINLGFTGIGAPVTLKGALAIQSMDGEHMFSIHEIQLDDDANAFRIENTPHDAPLAPSTTLAYDVTFEPPAEGDFTAKAILYLDEDPTQTAEVGLKGTAVFVDAGGGGGCSTTSGGSAGLAGLIAALGAVLSRRRRKAAIVAGVTALAGIAAADSTSNIDLALFDPTPTTVGTTMQVQTADVGANGDWVATALLSNSTDPLVLHYQGETHSTISRRTMMEIGGAYAFLGRFEAGLRMPLYNQTGDANQIGVESPSGTARGDLVAHVRARLYSLPGPSSLLLGASLALTLPTATGDQFAGVDKPTARALGLVTFSPAALQHRIVINGNIGAVVRAKSTFQNVEQGTGLAFGLAASVHVIDPVWVFGEAYGDMVPSARTADVMQSKTSLTTAEWLLGASFKPDPRIAITAAGGGGLVEGLGVPDLRAVLSVSVTPMAKAAPTLKVIEPPKVDGDADGDGIKDSVDACPKEAEDKDNYQDDDGCPEADNDNDGIDDADDKCPLQAEDKDGFEDSDGCPDLDDDGDGIPDTKDKCPKQAEDKDGFQDDDGCPDNDDDHDGVIDELDQCPKEPETINGNQDDDGCPDAGDPGIVLTPSAIEMLEPVNFKAQSLAKNSSNILGQVAATMRAHPEILRIKVMVHVQQGSDGEKDQALTDARAAAVKDAIVKNGINPDRVASQGMGSSKPLIAGKHSKYDERVEIIILERK
ncbi:MAG TPA: choice-of-anchor D domain-containing protein [Kofleriaceae bacterium]|jgi:MYXO-CTERM domain-containing protein